MALVSLSGEPERGNEREEEEEDALDRLDDDGRHTAGRQADRRRVRVPARAQERADGAAVRRERDVGRRVGREQL